MKLKRGTTSVRRLIFIADSSSTTGAGLANLTNASSGLVWYYFAGDLSNDVQVTPISDGTLGTWGSGHFAAVDNTNMPGWYEIGIPDAALDGGNEVAMQLRGVTNMTPVNIYIELDTVDYQTAAMGAVMPTIAGRTLDVSATGEAGVDWANVGSPTTTVALTNTTVSSTQKVDLETIKTQTLTAAAGITFGVYVGGPSAASTLTQTDITGGAYALNSASFAFNSGMDFTTTQKAATIAGVTTVTTVNGLAANSITASALATDAVNEIADGVLTRNVSNVEATAGEHTLATVVLATLEWSISGTDLVIKRTDGATTHYTKALTSTAGSGDVITGLN